MSLPQTGHATWLHEPCNVSENLLKWHSVIKFALTVSGIHHDIAKGESFNDNRGLECQCCSGQHIMTDNILITQHVKQHTILLLCLYLSVSAFSQTYTPGLP